MFVTQTHVQKLAMVWQRHNFVFGTLADAKKWHRGTAKPHELEPVHDVQTMLQPVEAELCVPKKSCFDTKLEIQSMSPKHQDKSLQQPNVSTK